MSKRVNIDGVGIVDFPDDATNDEIVSWANKQYPATKTDGAKSESKHGLVSDIVRGVEAAAFKKIAEAVPTFVSKELGLEPKPEPIYPSGMPERQNQFGGGPETPGSIKKAIQQASEPLLGETPKIPVLPDDTALSGAVKGAYNLAAGAADFATSGVGLATAAAGMVGGKGVQTVISGLFTIDLAKGLIKQGTDLYDKWDTLTPAQKAEGAVSELGTAAFAGLLGRSFVKGASESAVVARLLRPLPTKQGAFGKSLGSQQVDLPPAMGQAGMAMKQPVQTKGGVVSPIFQSQPSTVSIPDPVATELVKPNATTLPLAAEEASKPVEAKPEPATPTAEVTPEVQRASKEEGLTTGIQESLREQGQVAGTSPKEEVVSAQNLGVPDITTEMLQTALISAKQLTQRISSVKMAPYIKGQKYETIVFDLDGKTYKAELKGRNKDLVVGTDPEIDKGIASRALLDGHAIEIASTQSPPAAPGASPTQPMAQAASAAITKQPVAAAGGTQPLGIVPPGFAKISTALNNKWRSLQNTVKAYQSIIRSLPERRTFDQLFDAALNKTKILGQQAGKELSLHASNADLNAAMVIVESGFDRSRLAQFRQQAAGTGAPVRSPMALEAVTHADNNWTRLQSLALKTKNILDEQLRQERQNGIDVDVHDNYVPHMIDTDLWMGSQRPFVIAGRGGGIGTGFKKGRAFNTIFDAIEAGYQPKSMNVAELVEHRVNAGQQLIQRKQWADSLKGINDPSTRSPIVTGMVTKIRGPTGKTFSVAPAGYTPREIIPGVRIAVHEGYASLFDALTGTSRVSGTAPGHAALAVAGGIKHGLLAFDTFHASRILFKELFLTGRMSYDKGRTLLELNDRALNEAQAAGDITPEIADWVRSNRANAQRLINNGLNVGRVQELIKESQDFVRSIPGIGTFNKWVFDKVTRGAMLESGLIEFERVSKARPDLTPDQVARIVSRDLNAYFGNLGHQGFFKSPTFLDMSRLVALAPQWVEGMARTELRGAYQAAKGLTYDHAVHRTMMVGSLGKGVAQGLVAYLVGTQILNLVTRKQPTWQNPEEGHKLDAWIPDVTGKTKGFFLSPFSVVAELTHDMIRYSHTEQSKLDAAIRILSNKSSPAVRAATVLIGGKDWTGQHLPETWDRVKAAAWSLAPAPIPLSPLVKGNAPLGQTQRQLTASLGIKTEPAMSSDREIHQMAKEWMKKQGMVSKVPERTKGIGYGDLRFALANENEKEAINALAEARKTHTDQQIQSAAKSYITIPITGSHTKDDQFIRTLDEHGKQLVKKMRQERKKLYDKTVQLIRANPRK